MIKEEEIEKLKDHINSDGKLVITDDLTPKQKEKFELINSLNIDLLAVLSREKNTIDETELLDEGVSSSDEYSSVEIDDDEMDDEDSSSSTEIVEDDSSIETGDLSNFF